jgi:hypothetical protein
VNRRLAWGLLAVGLYLAGTAISFRLGLPGRPVYDGGIPPSAYNWVKPPAEFAEQNEPPQVGKGVMELTGRGSEARGILTADTQAQATLPEEVFPPRREADRVRFLIKPLDPSGVAPPPAGLTLDGNAYRYTAEYRPQGGPSEPATPFSVVLRYPRHATVVLHLEGGRWVRLPTTRIPASLVVIGRTTEMGIFVAAASPTAASRGVPPGLIGWVSLGAAVVGAGVGLWSRRRIRQRTAEADPTGASKPPRAGRGRRS